MGSSKLQRVSPCSVLRTLAWYETYRYIARTARKHPHQLPSPLSHGILHRLPRLNGTLLKILASPHLEPTIKLHCGISQSRRMKTSDLQVLKLIDSRMFQLNSSSAIKVKRISRKFTGILKYLVPSSRPLRMDSTSSKLCLSPRRALFLHAFIADHRPPSCFTSLPPPCLLLLDTYHCEPSYPLYSISLLFLCNFYFRFSFNSRRPR